MSNAECILEVAQILRDDSAGNKQASMTDMDRAIHYLERYAQIVETSTEDHINEIQKLKMEKNRLKDKLKYIKNQIDGLGRNIIID